MPEEGLETQELKEKLEEAKELAEGASWLTWLSLSTAVIAVLAAIASLESGSFANEAIVQKNDAVLHQSKAGDGWAHYQAAGVKAIVYATQAEAVAGTTPALAEKWRTESERERSTQRGAKEAAEHEQEAVKEKDEEAEHSLHVHHLFAQSVTVFQVSIAIAAIAALTKKKVTWWVSLATGAAGTAMFVMGLLAR